MKNLNLENINISSPPVELIELFSEKAWRQRIHLFDDVFTPGTKCEYEWQSCFMPENIKGMSFLDVGANDGMFAFLAEKYGASEVTAIDLFKKTKESCMKNGWPLSRISTIKKLKNSKVEIHNVSIYNLVELKKRFDLTYCGNVLAWLNDPLSALQQLAAVTNKTLLIREDISNIIGYPALEYVNSETSDCIFNGNAEFYLQSLKSLGFKNITFRIIDEYKILERRNNEFKKFKLKKGIKVFLNPFTESYDLFENDLVKTGSALVNNKLFFSEIGWIKLDDVAETEDYLPKHSIGKWIYRKRVKKGLTKHALIIADK
jgi:SAM-dependent methyltransferase